MTEQVTVVKFGGLIVHVNFMVFFSSLPGGTLYDKKIEMGNNMTEDQVVNIIRQIAEGIKYLHDHNFVHFGK